jgi:hypothetical protein
MSYEFVCQGLEARQLSPLYADGSEYCFPSLCEKENTLYIFEYDDLDFYRLVDSFAERYGLGGCRSITEFADMLNHEDPQLLNGLITAINDSANKTKLASAAHSKRTRTSRSGKVQGADLSERWGYDDNINDFLINFCGVPSDKVKEILKNKSDKGKSNTNRDFYEWLYNNITPEKLRSPNFDLKGALAKINEFLGKTEKVKVSSKQISRHLNGTGKKR